MPDAWENAHGLDPANPADANGVVPAGASPGDRHKGYTWIEYYVNELADDMIAEAVVRDRLGDQLDLEQIWMRQGISSGLRDLLWEWAVEVNAEFNRIAPGQQISEVAKRGDTWNQIRSARFPKALEAIHELRNGA
jgi:hypothetical protein